MRVVQLPFLDESVNNIQHAIFRSGSNIAFDKRHRSWTVCNKLRLLSYRIALICHGKVYTKQRVSKQWLAYSEFR